MPRRPISPARRSILGAVASLVMLATPGAVGGAASPARLTIEPAAIRLDGARSEAQLLVTGVFADGSVRDLTAEAEIATRGEPVVAIEPGGRLLPRFDGHSTVVARVGYHVTGYDIADGGRCGGCGAAVAGYWRDGWTVPGGPRFPRLPKGLHPESGIA